ncbi:MAG: tripartite tricarboxylate transporter TctB family protein [Pseudomonadota bacterium]|nr:tripartite tricarboxylate transporter TctB family protein [Pseudomonadota bacterium]
MNEATPARAGPQPVTGRARMLRRSGDFWSGVVLAGLGVYVVHTARGWDYTGPDGPGPGFFPLWYGIALVVLSLVLVLQSARAREPQGTIAWPEVRRAFMCWAAFVVSVALLNVAGFMASFALLTWFIVAIMFRRSHWLALSIGVGGAIVFQLVFDMALGVSLPPGLWR